MKKSNSNAHLMTNEQQIHNGMDLFRKQLQLMERLDPLSKVLNYIENKIYVPFLRNKERYEYKTKNVNHFINNLIYMDYIFNNSIPQLHGLTEDQALLGIAYAEMPLFEKEFNPRIEMRNMCGKASLIMRRDDLFNHIPLSKIDKYVVYNALDYADLNDIEMRVNDITAPILLAQMIHDILAVGHYILGTTIDAKRDIQDLTDDINLWYENQGKKKRYTFKMILGRFRTKFSCDKFESFKWSIDVDDEIMKKYRVFQKQIDDLYNNKDGE